jgi:hypothetical protein
MAVASRTLVAPLPLPRSTYSPPQITPHRHQLTQAAHSFTFNTLNSFCTTATSALVLHTHAASLRCDATVRVLTNDIFTVRVLQVRVFEEQLVASRTAGGTWHTMYHTFVVPYCLQRL